MIQIPCEREAGLERVGGKKQQREGVSHPYILRRIIYTFILVAVLLAACFYFEFLSDYDLVTMVLGFVVCIILQFILLSSYFNQEIKELKTDEIGVRSFEKIKTTFGELNSTKVQAKARTKYYHRQPNEQDKLFEEDNNTIYQNVMAHLRVKGEPNFNELIARVKGRWLQLESKVKTVEDFLLSMLKLYQSRKITYFRYKNRIKRLHQSDQHLAWAQFLTTALDSPSKSESLNNTSYYSQDELAFASSKGKGPESQTLAVKSSAEELRGLGVNWGTFNIYLLEKIKLAEKDVSDLKERVCKEFESFADTVRTSNLQFSKNREKLYEDFKASGLEKNHILRELEKTAAKIVEVSQGLSDKVGGGGEIELTMKREFELRLLKIESENLLIRLSRAQSCCFSYTQQLYSTLEAQSKQLQYLLQIINKKIHQYNHEMAGFGQNRAPPIKRILAESLSNNKTSEAKTLTHQLSAEECYSQVLSRRNNEGSFRGHLQQLLKFLEEVKEENSKAKAELKVWKDTLQRKHSGELRESKVMGESSQARLLEFTKGINDKKLLQMFEDVNELEDYTCKKLYQLLERELAVLKQFQQRQGLQEARRYLEDFKKKEAEYSKTAKKASKAEQDLTQKCYLECELAKNKLLDYVAEYLEKKVVSCLPEVLRVAIQNEESYQNIASSIDLDRAADETNFSSASDAKTKKYEAFSNCILKSQGENSVDEVLKNERSYEQGILDSEVTIKYLIDLSRESQEHEDRLLRFRKPQKVSDFFRQFLPYQGRGQLRKVGLPLWRYESSVPKTLSMVNNVLGILLHEWANSEFFHEFVKEELLVSLNRKKPDIVEHLDIDFFRIVERDKETPLVKVPFGLSRYSQSELEPAAAQQRSVPVPLRPAYPLSRQDCSPDRFAVQGRQAAQTGGQAADSRVRMPHPALLHSLHHRQELRLSPRSPQTRHRIQRGCRQFLPHQNPLRTSYRIEFTQFIKTYAAIKLSKKFLWPKRMTLAVPLAFKSTLDLAIQQRKNYEKEKERQSKKAK